MTIMTTTTVTTVRRLEIPASTVEDIVKAWLAKDKGIPLGQVTEVDWDASSEGLVRGLTVTTREVTEETA